MNYEKQYKEALERARKLYEQGTITESLCYVFPELCESEDERIRKVLIDFFNKGAENGEQTYGVYDKDILAWIKKQGEQKPTWSEDDEKRVESLHGWLDTLVNYIHHDVTVSLDLRRERMQQVEQLKTWLKSIKERVQPKKEWNEEDERTYKSVLYAFEHNFSLNSEQQNLIKSLKDRVQPQNKWKPTEEQMAALSDINCTGCISYAGQGQELINLYNDLKKLKG